jgi:hypothetical protein
MICDHPENLNIYCKPCSIALCVNCMLAGQHNTHEIQAIKQACEEIQKDWTELKIKYADMDKKCESINKDMENSQMPQQLIGKMVDNQFDELINIVN